ncbi:MAG: alpha/beta hydrolase [Geminicoccaceae bacterium]
MDIHFATNRNILKETPSSAEFGERFDESGPQFFRVGVADVVQVGPDPTADDGYAVRGKRLYSEKPARRGGPLVRASQGMFEELRQQLKDDERDVLVYLHGFANDFDNSIMRAAALQTLYAQRSDPGEPDPIVFVFAWPSNGKTFPATEYFSDRDDAQMSGLAMARALIALIDFMVSVFRDDRQTILDAREAGRVPTSDELKCCGQRLNLIAHSMGNWALRHAVLSLHRQLGKRPLPRLFKNALLVAADEDDDALGDDEKLGMLSELAQSIHVYHSTDDRALQISDVTKLNPNRLGTDGPSDLPRLTPRVFTVDCSLVDETILEHGCHQYYRIRREVIDDIKAIISGTPPDRIDPTRRQVIRPGRSWRLLPLT